MSERKKSSKPHPPQDHDIPSGLGFLRGTVIRQDDLVSPDFDAWNAVKDPKFDSNKSTSGC